MVKIRIIKGIDGRIITINGSEKYEIKETDDKIILIFTKK